MLCHVIASLPAMSLSATSTVFMRPSALVRQVVSARVLPAACAVTFAIRATCSAPNAELPLTPTREKAKLLRLAGIQDVWVCHFTPEIARLAAHEFLALIQARWRLAELWVGHDFALGRARAGSTDVLRRIGFEQGWRLQMVAPLEVEGQVISSTRIRNLLSAQRHAEATSLLGRSTPTIAR
jgi:riboflavin kinase/FMN adenylyltransferase